MSSPFPGMDPYLERHWGDVHSSIITYTRDQLQKILPKGLRARSEERVFFESFDEGKREFLYPDVRVYDRGDDRGGLAVADGSVAVADPYIVEIAAEPRTETFVEIIDTSTGGRVVTVIEFLSPSNKSSGEGQRLYERKQTECSAGGVSLIEIDFLRSGRKVTNARPGLVPDRFLNPYHACVRRGWKPLSLEIYNFPLREKLPAIRVPLRESDSDVPLNLQSLIDQCYDNGGYEDIDYSVPPIPDLDPDDAQWADALLREQGFRS